MKRIVTSFAVTVSLAALVGACSSSSNPGGSAATDAGADTSPAVTADQAATDTANAICARWSACAPFYVLLGYGNEATCASRLKTQFADALAANGTGTTPAWLETCAGAIPAVSCADVFAVNLPDACKPVAGTVAKGGACADHSQCATKFCAIDATKGICGTCQDPPAENDPCVSNDCQDGYTCGSKDGRCHKFAGLGALCDSNHVCNATLTCFQAKCAAPTAAGGACDPPGTTTLTHPACDGIGGDWCSVKTSKCEAIVQGAALAAKCGYDTTAGSLTVCDATSYCSITSPTTYSGTCEARVADGAACDASKAVLGGPCTAPATCTNGTCSMKDPATCK